MHPSTSLVISTYNWPEALALSLKSVLAQSRLPDEVLIADDGSVAATAAVIQEFQQHFPVPLRHIWQEDAGFRLAMIRNKAIAQATGEYIIQIDGDIIMHPRFVEDHIRFAKPDAFVRASRVYLNEELSARMLTAQSARVSIFSKGISNFFSAIRLPLAWPFFATTYKNSGDERYEIHGCNMAFWKKDVLEVNGYNEAFFGWGPEDKEFVARLLNKGKEKRFIKQGAIAFHIYHKENQKTYLAENERALKETILLKRTTCASGINQYI